VSIADVASMSAADAATELIKVRSVIRTMRKAGPPLRGE
jgi:hypothetical protein